MRWPPLSDLGGHDADGDGLDPLRVADDTKMPGHQTGFPEDGTNHTCNDRNWAAYGTNRTGNRARNTNGAARYALSETTARPQ
jgi:hypothetical protein